MVETAIYFIVFVIGTWKIFILPFANKVTQLRIENELNAKRENTLQRVSNKEVPTEIEEQINQIGK